jgi:hypothetical protein
MAKHEQLDVLGISAPAAAKQQPQQRHKREVDERQDHRAILSEPAITPDQRFGTLDAGRLRECRSQGYDQLNAPPLSRRGCAGARPRESSGRDRHPGRGDEPVAGCERDLIAGLWVDANDPLLAVEYQDRGVGQQGDRDREHEVVCFGYHRL